MTKTELIKRVAEATGQKQKVVTEVVNAFLSEIAGALGSGEKVKLLPNFGVFEVVERKARTGRNPQTGKKIKIPARKVVRFKPAKALKEAVK